MTPNNLNTSARTGKKRKRGNNDTKEVRQPFRKPPPALEDVFRNKLHHGVKEVKSTAKKAKDFEIRRAIKRLKNARNQPSRSSDTSVSNMEKELQLLKNLDHEAAALVALRTKFNKGHFSKNPSFHTALETVLPRPPSPSLKEPASDLVAMRKVESRLLSSKVLADGIKNVLDSLRALVESPVTASDTESDDNSESNESEAEETPLRRENVTAKSKTKAQIAPAAERYSHPSDGLSRFVALTSSGGDDEGTDAGTADGLEDDENAEVASWESGSVASSSDVRPASKRHKGPTISGVDSGSGPEDSGESGSESEEGIDPDALEDMESDEGDEDGPSGSNRFLPSLQVGFTAGDSDTGSWKDDDDAAGDNKRKNRRGQRARQAIWEKKYGQNAKHVKRQREEAKALAQAKALTAKARTATRTAAAEDAEYNGPGRGKGRGRGRGRGVMPSSQIPTRLDGGWKGGAENRNAAVRKSIGGTGVHADRGPLAKGTAAPEKLHPSWEAKRKLKEKEEIGIVPSQGKKIKF